MAAMIQTYPQQTTVTMLHTRPTSTAGMMPSGQAQQNHPYMGPPQAPRAVYHGAGGSGYRGSSAPMQQYAFMSTPNLNQSIPWQQQYGAYRTNSSPAVPAAQGYDPNANFRGRVPHNGQQTNMAYMHPMGVSQNGSWDDSAIPAGRGSVAAPRPHSTYLSGPSQPAFAPSAPAKAAPDRYGRQAAQTNQHARSQSSSLPSSLALGNANQIYNGPNNAKAAQPTRPNSFYASAPGLSVDDSLLYRQPAPEEVNRLRRRTVHTLDSTESAILSGLEHGKKDEPSLADTLTFGPSNDRFVKTSRPSSSSASVHNRNGSSESVSSSRSNHSRPSSATNRHVSVPTGNPSLLASNEATVPKHDNAKLVNIPARGSSSDATKRTTNPSPLSKAATMANDANEQSSSPGAPNGVAVAGVSANLESPAAKQLAALNQMGGRPKTKTSRLRRAFSFGSAAELRKANGGEDVAATKPEPTKLHKDPTPAEAYDAEQARIAEAQEAAGIGSNIYGSRFMRSTDNLSISSTASSASLMLRKMGRGMKKGSRSLTGLFRPKSVVGVPAAEPLAPEASVATVSMVTVEAETQRVNVNPDPQGANGGTGFPRLERNSIDTAQVPEMVPERLGSSGTDNSNPRKSIMGGDKERAEVLAAVRKGILKRSASPANRAAGASSPQLEPPTIPAIIDSPNSSAPSTPNDEAHGHKRSGSVAISNEDYFMSALRLRQDSKSAPGTPQGGTKRNATFSPRIVFYDTWPSQEYDRRGEIATCNRLTPMLAQQIKEELNSLKMEMEVHENSKIYTHFF